MADEKKVLPYLESGTILSQDDMSQMAIKSRQATATEHEVGVMEAIRLYPKAIFWSVFFAVAVIAAGYDGQIIASFYGLPAFQQKYGNLYDGVYVIAAPWQAALGMGNPIGNIIFLEFANHRPNPRFYRSRVANGEVWASHSSSSVLHVQCCDNFHPILFTQRYCLVHR
jgi:hypothetical protein